MAAVLTAKSTLVCPHGFPFTVSPSRHLLTVDDASVVVGTDLLNTKITSCTNNPPCTAVTSITAGLSTTLRVGGDQVALATAAGTTDVLPGWHVQLAGQQKLEAA